MKDKSPLMKVTSGTKVTMMLEPALVERMNAVQRQHGIPKVAQVRAALNAWLPQYEKPRR
jgi:hypothetical protein